MKPTNSIVSLGVVGLLALATPVLHADLLGQYTFDQVTANAGGTVDPTPPPVLDGLTFGSFSAAGLSANPRSSDVWSFSGWTLGGAPDAGRYYEATLAPEPGYLLTLEALEFGVRRSGSGPRDYVVRSSVDDFGANLPAVISPANVDLSVAQDVIHFVNDNTSTQPANVTGSRVNLGTGFSGMDQPVTFRFYGFNAEQSGGTFAVDDVAVLGAVSPVPEPEAYAAVFTGALAGFAVWRRCRPGRGLRGRVVDTGALTVEVSGAKVNS